MSFNTTWLETVESREVSVGLSNPTGTLLFVGINNVAPDDDADANLSLQALIPIVFPGASYVTLTYQGYKVTPLGAGNYKGVVNYARQSPLYTFEIAGGTQKITNSLYTRGRFPAAVTPPPVTFAGDTTAGSAAIANVTSAGQLNQYAGSLVSGPGIPSGAALVSASGTTVTISLAATATASNQTFTIQPPVVPGAPDFQGAIGVSGDQVNGVEIPIVAAHWEETYHVPPWMITDAYEKALEDLCWSTNRATFRNRDPGEVQFQGARGSQKGLEDVELSFKFARSKNRFDFYVGNIHVPAKLGWDYLWIRYADELDQVDGAMVKVPSGVYIEQVFEDGDFSVLGIGG